MSTKERLDNLDRRFKVNTSRAYDEPSPRWVRLAPAAATPGIAVNFLSEAFSRGSTARTVLQVVSGVLLLAAVVVIAKFARWLRKHRIRAPRG